MQTEFGVTPIGKPRMTQRDKWLNPPRLAVTRYRLAKHGVETYALMNNYVLQDEVNIIFVMPMPPSWSNKKCLSMNGKPHQVKPDIDNMLKFVFDVMCPLGDQSIHSVVAKKIWGEEGKIIFIDKDKNHDNESSGN
jgi:Holliday junction resolvase RusA-like endonuclease